MKVGLDVAPLLQTRAGTARWVSGLQRGLEGRPDVDVAPLTWGGPGRWTAVVRDVLWYPALLPRAAARAGADVLHCTIFRAPPRASLPTIVTVHDLAVLRQPEVFPAWTRLYGRTALRPTLRAADRVFAVSEFSKREVVELARVDADRVDVVPNALETVFTSSGTRLEGDYVLAVGTLEPRKNLARIAAAVDGELRVVGPRGWGGVEPPPNVVWLGEVSDEELAALYRGARCLVYASLYEGFGIPVAEALACGCPIVTSAESAMQEFAGPDATYVDPDDVDSIRDGIARSFRPEPRRVASWTEVARATEAVYREVA